LVTTAAQADPTITVIRPGPGRTRAAATSARHPAPPPPSPVLPPADIGAAITAARQANGLPGPGSVNPPLVSFTPGAGNGVGMKYIGAYTLQAPRDGRNSYANFQPTCGYGMTADCAMGGASLQLDLTGFVTPQRLYVLDCRMGAFNPAAAAQFIVYTDSGWSFASPTNGHVITAWRATTPSLEFSRQQSPQANDIGWFFYGCDLYAAD
jgi:hypothetical protein